MKQFLFRFILFVGNGITLTLNFLENVIHFSVSRIFAAIEYILEVLINLLLKLIVPSELKAAEQLEEAALHQRELQLLASASKIKDHAIEIGQWTPNHTMSLNGIGSALLNDCDWKEASVHQYLKEIVESVPGLQYGVASNPFKEVEDILDQD